MPPALSCSVVIPTYNAEAHLGNQLAALSRQTHAEPFEVIIADNGSIDGSAALANSYIDHLPHLRVVDASRRRGRSAARNDGISAAATDRILLCDADDVVDEGWIDAMITALDSSDYVGGALEMGLINTPTAQAWTPLEVPMTGLPSLWTRHYAISCNMAIRRHVFEAINGFDESYLASAEEIDFAWRAFDAGHPVTFAPRAVVHYRIRGSLREAMRRQFDSGVGTVQVFATFRPAGVTVRSWHRRLRHELLLLRRFPWRGGAVERGQWLTTIAFETGKIRGAILFRCPIP